MTLTQPILTPLSGGKYLLKENYAYEWSLSSHVTRRLTIKAGFISDIASVPPVFWALGFPADGLHRAAAVMHDALYQARGHLPSEWVVYRESIAGRDLVATPARFSRRDADRLFGRMMREAGVPQWRRRTMYRAVRLCSWLFW